MPQSVREWLFTLLDERISIYNGALTSHYNLPTSNAEISSNYKLVRILLHIELNSFIVVGRRQTDIVSTVIVIPIGIHPSINRHCT